MGPDMGPDMGPLGPTFQRLGQYTESCRMRSMHVRHDGEGLLTSFVLVDPPSWNAVSMIARQVGK